MSILVKSNKSFSLLNPKFQNVQGKIIDYLKGKVLMAYIFGSYATGKVHDESDIDLIIIKETSVPFTKRPFEFEELLDIYPCTDILVYTPEEFNNLTTNPTPGFWKSVVKTMKRII